MPTAEIIVRDATPNDAELISALITGLIPFFLADPGDAEAAASFSERVAPGTIRSYLISDRYRYHVALLNDELVGVAGIRDNTHLYHLVIAERVHRQGLARRLWSIARHEAEEAGNPGRFTVNASQYAVSVYERFGFVATGPEQQKDGIAFVPMERDERTVRRSG